MRWLTVFLLLGGCVPLSETGTSTVRSFGTPQLIAKISDKEIPESSGLAPSRIQDDVLYTHNDSGDVARFFRFAAGKVTGEFRLAGAGAIDWEDMASATLGGKNWLYFGDIGDNSARRKSICVYRVGEPSVSVTSGELQGVESYELTYPDGPHNAETLLVHPMTGDITIVSKTSKGPSGIYGISCPSRSGKYVLKKIGEITLGGPIKATMLITGGAWSPDGKHVALRTYVAGYEFDVDGPEWFKGTPRKIKLALEGQGEAITYTRNGDAICTSSEGLPFQSYKIPIID